MTLKTKHGILESEPSHYEWDTRPNGINFKLNDGTALFAPYCYLSHAFLLHSNEIIFHYPFGLVHVRGDRLERIYRLLLTNELSSIDCDTDKPNKVDEPQIREVVFEAIDTLVI